LLVAAMSARDKLPATPVETAQDLADKHDLRLHRCKQLRKQVSYRGLNEFIAGFCSHKGDAEITVYLEGIKDPVRPCDITILERIHE
jgi:hypothetical protein